MKKSAALYVKVPSWVHPMDVEIEGTPEKPEFINGYFLFTHPPIDKKISLKLNMPTRKITLKHRTRDIRVVLLGDEVQSMENHGADLTFFPSLD